MIRQHHPLTILSFALLLGLPASAGTRDSWRSLLPTPVTDADYHDNGAPPAERVELGRLLFFDKELSGNRNISCATCHHPQLATADGVALGLGEGAHGLGPERRPGNTMAESVHERVPRNATALFNLGALEYTRFFHDGRVEEDHEGNYASGFITPVKWKLPGGLANALAAQAMFPVASATEMAGQKGENPIADASALANAAGPGGVWETLARRLRAHREYVARFQEAFPDRIRSAQDITYIDAANAIAAFEAVAFRSDQSPFDDYLRGNESALDPAQQRGLKLFYGRANCVSCHSGAFQTDHGFHAIAMPQLGPGKGDGRDGDYWRASGETAFIEDFGRGRVTFRSEDRFRFRTPSLRNVALTGPWGHAGAYNQLEDVVRHHLRPTDALESYTLGPDALPPMGRVLELSANRSALNTDWLSDPRREAFMMRDTWVQGDSKLRHRIAAANELEPMRLSDAEVEDLVAFLHALTDPGVNRLTELVPTRVPSGLPVAD